MISDIGSKVKELRSQKNLTLKDLSESTGFSIGYLSQFERGLSSIATDALQKIADVFGVPLLYFFDSEKTVKKGFIKRSYEREVDKILNSRFIYYDISSDSKNMEPKVVDILPDPTDEDIYPYSHIGEEFVFVLEGILTLVIESGVYELYPGDSAHYDASVSHNWVNKTSKMVKILAIHSDAKPKSEED